MEKFTILDRIKQLYDNGENIIEYLKKIDNRSKNTIQDILISYDFQAGTYAQGTETTYKQHNINYTSALANVMVKLGNVKTILEVGVGEATILGNMARNLPTHIEYGGFDISWSRIHWAKKYLTQLGVKAFLCTGDLFSSPFEDSSIDVVYTSHSLEPNGGREEEALVELYRITNKYLVLLEPSFELADEAGKHRMTNNGYIKNLKETILKLGYDLMEERPFDYSVRPSNPTALYIIRKNEAAKSTTKITPACPLTKKPLVEGADYFFSPDSLLSYPKIKSIPCLAPFNAVLTSKMNDE